MKKHMIYSLAIFTLIISMVLVTPVKANGVGTISGYVYDENGAPVLGAIVISHDGATFRVTSTNSSGFYTLTSVPANANHLQATYSTRALSHYWGFQVCADTTYTNVNFNLRPGAGSVSGKVIGSTGEALANVSINVWTKINNSTDNGSWVSTTTDANGNYKTPITSPLYGLPTGPHYIQATYDGQVLFLENVAVTAGSDTPNNNFTFITGSPAGTGTITGYVRDENGSPIAGANVISHDGVTFRSATSDSIGYYSLNAVPANTNHLQATVNGRAYSHYWGFEVAPNGVYANTNFTLRPGGGSISGYVTDCEGEPLEDAVINIWQKTAQGYGDGSWASTTTDGNGFYQTSLSDAPGPGLPSGTFFVQATYGTAVSKDNILVVAGSTTSNVNLSFVSGSGVVSGKVTDETSGQGIAGVNVYIDNGIVQSVSTTDANGYYLNSGLPTGTFSIVISKNGYANAHRYGLQVLDGETSDNVDFVLTNRIGQISGLITSANGTPMVGVEVFADSDEGSGFSNTVSGADGRYVLENLAPMVYYVHVKANGYAPMMRQAEAAAGVNTPNFNFTLVTASGSIVGKVTKDGQPASGAAIFINSSSGAQNVYYGNAMSDANGNYSVQNLVPGDYDVHIQGVNGYANQVTFYVEVGDCATSVNFNLTNGAATIRGRVTDVYGNPLAGANVQAFNNANPGTWASVQADDDGYYTINNMWAGLYTLYANKAGFESVAKYYTNISDGFTQINFVMGQVRAIQPEQNKITVVVKDNFGTYRGVLVQVTSGLSVNWTASSQASWLLLDNDGHTYAQSGAAGDGLILRFDPTMTDYGTYTTNLVLNAADANSATIAVTIIKVPSTQFHQIFIPAINR